MAPRLTPSQSAEDYLERIHELIEEKGYARVVDIASSLKVWFGPSSGRSKFIDS